MKRILLSAFIVFATIGASAQLLYKISGNGLTAPSYIVGTYHFAPVSFVDSIPGIRQAMAETQQTYGELVMDAMISPDSLALLQQAMMLPDSLSLGKLLSADEMSRLNAYLMKLMGMDLTNPLMAQQMGKMTPMALGTTLAVLCNMKKMLVFDPQNGFDNYFQKEAHAQGKSVGGLETIAFQIEALFKGKTLERQRELLMCQIDNAAIMDEMTDSIIHAFYKQDLDAIERALNAKLHNSCDSRPEEEEMLIDKRNADWLTKMPALMALKPTLFAVGAGHLPGERGLLNLLRGAGYTIEGVVK